MDKGKATDKIQQNSYLHELHNKIYELVFLHLLTMVVSDKKADIITLPNKGQWSKYVNVSNSKAKENICWTYSLGIYFIDLLIKKSKETKMSTEKFIW